MAKFIISIGSFRLNKILLPVLLALDLLVLTIINMFIPKGKSISVINNFGSSIGEILTRILPCIFRIKIKTIRTRKNCSKTNFQDYFLFFIIYILFNGLKLLLTLIKVKFNEVSSLKTSLSVEMVCYLLLSIWILKYRYYIHNFLSLAVFSICTIIMDLILKNFQAITLFDTLYFLYPITEDLLACYVKYLLNKTKFHVYWNLLLFFGIFHFIYTGLLFAIDLFTTPDSVKETFEAAEIKYVIIHFFIYLLFNGFIKRYLIFYIIDALSPNHVLLASAIYDIIYSLIENKDNDDKSYLYCLIPNCFQILSLLIYLEILELNLCNLSKNTRKNIRKREQEEMNGRSTVTSVDSLIEIDQGLIVEPVIEYDINKQLQDNEDNDDIDNFDCGRKSGKMIELVSK